MSSIEEVIDLIVEKSMSVVYGNLGRNPHLIAENLERMYRSMNVEFVSSYYPLPQKYRMHTNMPYTRCDLLVYIEPQMDSEIVIPDSMTRVAVFTSHLLFKIPKDCTLVAFHDTNDEETELKRAKMLAETKQENYVQNHRADIEKEKIDYFEVKTLGRWNECDHVITPHKPLPVFEMMTYVVVDLTRCVDAVDLMLQMLDAFDVLKANEPNVYKFKVCFPENSINRYETAVQNHINKFYCQIFTMGNITNNASLLKRTPFYHSFTKGTDKSSMDKVTTLSFFDYKIFVPSNRNQAFWVSALENVRSIGNKVFVCV